MNKRKKATINPRNNDDKCFHYATTIAFSFEEIKKELQKVSNIKSLIKSYNRGEKNNPSKTEDWKTFEKNNLTIVVNILYIKLKEICPPYISKITLNCEKQIIILMIPNEEK